MSDTKPAERAWWRYARVRITGAYYAGNPTGGDRRFTPGEELEMVQWGRSARPVNRRSWWTDTDIDGAFIVPADLVEVLQEYPDRSQSPYIAEDAQ